MESRSAAHWSVRDDSPVPRRTGSSSAIVWLTVAAIVAAAGAIGYYFWPRTLDPGAFPPVSVAPVPAAAPAEPQAPQAPSPPPVRHLIDEPAPAAPALPALDNSDSLARESIARLVGAKIFQQYVRPTLVVRRIVATVDNLPRPTAPNQMMPLEAVPGRFAVSGTDESYALHPKNAARYAPYVRVLESVDAKALVRRYVETYPLFQRAYEELGYPNRYFNDRLIEAIDDLLAAPQPADPVALTQPKVMFEFADPDLESRSAGQKIMMRMGSENAARVKAKLREIRGEIMQASRARQ